MHKIITSIMFLTLFAFGTLTASATTVNITASVDKNVISLDDQITLTLTIYAEARSVSEPKIPQIDGLDIYQSGSSQSFNFVNGKISTSYTYTYILIPSRAGRFTIPSFSVRVKGREYKSDPIVVDVKSQGTQVPGAQSGRIHKNSNALAKEESLGNKKVFITASLDKSSAYVNEQVTLTFKFYQAIRLSGNPELERPKFEGFWVEDLPPQRKYYETVNGIRYYVVEIKTALFPTSSGEKVIEPYKLTITPDEFSTLFNWDPFDMFNGRIAPPKPQTLYTKRIKLNVKPLPLEGKPADFTGAVGNFNFRAAPDIIETEVNEPINFTMSISGTGNIKAVEKPNITIPPEFRSYPSNSSENISKTNYKFGGTKKFEEILIPNSPGTFNLPPVSFSYFDLMKGKYITLKSKSYTIKVKPSTVVGSSGGPTAVQDIGSTIKDLRYLKTDLGSYSAHLTLYNSPIFWAIQIIPVFAIFGLFLVRRRKDKLENDISYARHRRAKSVSKKILKLSLKHLKEREYKEFYASVSKALINYLADKLSLSPSGLTNDIIQNALRNKVSEEITAEIFEILKICDFHRFSPSTETGKDESKFISRIEKLIDTLEKNL